MATGHTERPVLLESAEELLAIDAVIADTVAGLGRLGVRRSPAGWSREPRTLDDELSDASKHLKSLNPPR